MRTLKELARSYLTISQDLVRVMVRVKALYRSCAIPCSVKQVYAVRHRTAWLVRREPRLTGFRGRLIWKPPLAPVLPSLQAEGVELAVHRADIDHPVSHGR